jgi:hypothetical protein
MTTTPTHALHASEQPSLHVLTGAPIHTWDKVLAVQHQPFLYLSGYEAPRPGEYTSPLQTLFDRLSDTPLDPRFEAYGDFITLNPCLGIRNPASVPSWPGCTTVPQWIAGPRLFTVEPVVHVLGNFLHWSQVFSIYTNDRPTIDRLTFAIRANQQTAAYQEARRALRFRDAANRVRPPQFTTLTAHRKTC